MSFVSLEFLFFGPLMYLGYIAIGHRNPVPYLTISSLIFYGYHQIFYIPLLLAVAFLDFVAAKQIHRTSQPRARRAWLVASVISNLSLLGYFKYWNFFAGNLAAATAVGPAWVHHYVLPLGLSFYTLQALGYVFDVYRRTTVPEARFGTYFLFVSFFPQLVAGPIERSNRLIPQLKQLGAPPVDGFRAGCVLMAWGLFVKLVAADNLAPFVGAAIREPALGLALWPVAAVGMCRVYCDFLAYTAIARGLGKAFGVELSHNFRQPFFAKTPAGFWQRWHITLTRWVVDYVQIPLAKRLRGEPGRSLLTIGVLCLIGFWHGASWNFLLFGLFHGVVMRLWGPASAMLRPFGRYDVVRHASARLALLVVLAASAPMFLVRDFGELAEVMAAMVSWDAGTADPASFPGKTRLLVGTAALGAVLAIDWLFYNGYKRGPEQLSMPASVGLVGLLTVLVVCFGNFDVSPFVYFEF